MSALELGLVAVFAALASTPQHVTGFGFALLLAPVLLLVLDADDTVVIVTALGGIVAAIVALRLRKEIAWRTTWVLSIASLAGMPLGLAVLLVADESLLQALIAMAVIASTLVLARGLTLSGGTALEATVGIASGVLRTSTSTAGPPVIIYLQGLRRPADEFRATISAYFAASGVIAVAIFAAAGRVDGDVGLGVLAGLPGIAAGSVASYLLAGRTSERWFRRAVIALLLVSATVALGTAFVS